MLTSVTVVGVLTADANQARSARRRPSLEQPVHQFRSLSAPESTFVAIVSLCSVCSLFSPTPTHTRRH
eukprot:scaffold75856_cov60-Phaeocystis_antarctica.AAC.1